MTTKAELIQDLDEFLARDDLTSGGNQETFLRIAQAQIDRKIRTRAQEVTTQLIATARTVALPDDYLAMRSISLDTTLDRRIDYLTPERIREAPIWQNQGGFRDAEDTTPLAYTIEGNSIVFAPEPSADNPITLDFVYYAKLSRLVNDTDTNSLLTNDYDVYLWAILKAGCIFLQESELAGTYHALFKNALEDLSRNERWGRFSGSNLFATGSPRRTV
jgi:hypothetical protein